jgi:hypothetical protein
MKTQMSIRRLRISGEILDSFLRSNELWQSSLPDDAHVVGVAGGTMQTFVLLIQSKEFLAVRPGELIPFVDPVFKRRNAAGS